MEHFRQSPFVIESSTHVRGLVADLWASAELNWFLGKEPDDFDRWTIEKVRDGYRLIPPDLRPGLHLSTRDLRTLFTLLYSRLLAQLVGLEPTRIVGDRLTESGQARFDELLKWPFWEHAASVGGGFFYRMIFEAIADPTTDEELRDLHEELDRRGIGFLRIAEWVSFNYDTLWLLDRFRRALSEGRQDWRPKANRWRYATAVDRILEDASPYSAEIKQALRSEEEQLRKAAEGRSDLDLGFARSLARFEDRIGGTAFGKRTSDDPLTRRQWPYFRFEIVNVASFLIERGLTETSAFKLTKRVLAVLAKDSFPALGESAVRKRFKNAIESGVESRTIPELPSPRHKFGVSIVPE